MKKYTISIPEPCTVPLQHMTPIPGGKYCSSCQKQVVDFTGMTDRQMMAYFEKHPGCCGSFLPSQLDREITVKSGRRWMPAALIAGVLAIVMPESGKGQVQLTGIIHDGTNHQPLPGTIVAVVDQQGKETRIGTMTQADGTFSLVVPEEYKMGLKLQFRSLGYETKVVVVPERQMKAKEPVNLKLDMNYAVLSGLTEVVIVKSSRWKRFKHRLLGAKNHKKKGMVEGDEE